MFSSRSLSVAVVALFALIALALGGCGSAGTNAASQVLKTPELPTDKQSKCKVAKSQSEPLIVEWPDAARGRLESISRRGLVAVRYEGCELAVLSRCTVKPSKAYDYSPITRKQSKVVIKDADELYASMPVGAVRLESKLQSSGQLNVQMTIVGRYESAVQNVYREELEGDCSEATHVIAALTVGSFTFSAGSDAEIGGGATVLGAGGGAKSTAARETLQRDGDEAACMRATNGDKAPPEGCGALLQIEVMPLAKGAKAAVVVAPPVVLPTPDPSASEKPAPSAKPLTCKKGERIENGVCVKAGGKGAATKPKAAVASAATTCAVGQHAQNGRCIDDDVPPKEPPPTPRPAPPDPTPTCLSGSHLENGTCVADAYVAPPPISAYGGSTTASEAEERSNPWRTLLIYTGVGSGLAATYLGIAALSNAGKASDGCSEQTKTCTPEGAEARDKAKTFAILTDVALGVTILSVVGFVLLPSHVKVSIAPTNKGAFASAGWQF